MKIVNFPVDKIVRLLQDRNEIAYLHGQIAEHENIFYDKLNELPELCKLYWKIQNLKKRLKEAYDRYSKTL